MKCTQCGAGILRFYLFLPQQLPHRHIQRLRQLHYLSKNGVEKLNRSAIAEVSENTTKMTDIFKRSLQIVSEEYLQGLLQRPPLVYKKKQFIEQYPTNESCAVLLIAKPSFWNSLMWAILSKARLHTSRRTFQRD